MKREKWRYVVSTGKICRRRHSGRLREKILGMEGYQHISWYDAWCWRSLVMGKDNRHAIGKALDDNLMYTNIIILCNQCPGSSCRCLVPSDTSDIDPNIDKHSADTSKTIPRKYFWLFVNIFGYILNRLMTTCVTVLFLCNIDISNQLLIQENVYFLLIKCISFGVRFNTDVPIILSYCGIPRGENTEQLNIPEHKLHYYQVAQKTGNLFTRYFISAVCHCLLSGLLWSHQPWIWYVGIVWLHSVPLSHIKVWTDSWHVEIVRLYSLP